MAASRITSSLLTAPVAFGPAPARVELIEGTIVCDERRHRHRPHTATIRRSAVCRGARSRVESGAGDNAAAREKPLGALSSRRWRCHAAQPAGTGRSSSQSVTDGQRRIISAIGAAGADRGRCRRGQTTLRTDLGTKKRLTVMLSRARFRTNWVIDVEHSAVFTSSGCRRGQCAVRPSPHRALGRRTALSPPLPRQSRSTVAGIALGRRLPLCSAIRAIAPACRRSHPLPIPRSTPATPASGWRPPRARAPVGRGEAIRARRRHARSSCSTQPLIGQRLGYAELSGLDLLELFAFVHPGALRRADARRAGARGRPVAARARRGCRRASCCEATAALLAVPDGGWAEREGAWTGAAIAGADALAVGAGARRAARRQARARPSAGCSRGCPNGTRPPPRPAAAHRRARSLPTRGGAPRAS